jgi:urocanate hydratase
VVVVVVLVRRWDEGEEWEERERRGEEENVRMEAVWWVY